MICPKCGAIHEGDTCPYCAGKTQPMPEYTPQPASGTQSNTVIFIILGIVGGFLMLVTLGILFVGMTTRNVLQNVNIPEDNGHYAADNYHQEAQSIPEDETYDPEADEAAKNAWQQKSGIYQNGDYEVGKDVPAGTYIILSDGMGYGDFYTGVYASASMSDASEIYGGWSKNSRYVVLELGQYLHFSHATMYDPALVDITLDPFSQSGMFLVGRDLEPGTYTVVPDNDQYDGTFEVFYNLTASGTITKESYYIGLDGEEEVTLSEGEYIQTDFCILKK